jgi:hypothetical protein
MSEDAPGCCGPTGLAESWNGTEFLKHIGA